MYITIFNLYRYLVYIYAHISGGVVHVVAIMLYGFDTACAIKYM